MVGHVWHTGKQASPAGSPCRTCSRAPRAQSSCDTSTHLQPPSSTCSTWTQCYMEPAPWLHKWGHHPRLAARTSSSSTAGVLPMAQHLPLQQGTAHQQKGTLPSSCSPGCCHSQRGGAGPPHMPRPQGNPSDAALQAPQPQPLAPSLSAPVHPRRVPVAHFVGQVPHRIMHALRLPPTNGVAAAGVAHAEHACASASAAASTQHMLAVQGAVCWAAAPTLTDPDTSITHSIAVHRSLEQALAVALDGDVVLLQPGRYSLGGSTGSGSGGEDAGGSCPAAAGGMQVPWVMEGGPLRRSIRIIGLGARRQVRQTANCSPFLSSVSALCWVQCSKMCCPDVVECVNATAS